MHAACLASSLHPRAIQAPGQRVRGVPTSAQASQARRGARVFSCGVAAVWHGCTVRPVALARIPHGVYGWASESIRKGNA